MVAHVQKTAEGYAIVLSAEALRELNVAEGSAVELRAVPADRGVLPEVAVLPGREYVSTDEALDIFHRTKDRFRHAYEELAK